MASKLVGQDVYVVPHMPGRCLFVHIITAPLAVKYTTNFDLYVCVCVCMCVGVCMCVYVCVCV